MANNANLYAHFRSRFPSDMKTELLETSEGRSVSYLEADEMSAKLAGLLLSSGAKAGDRVTVQVHKSVENLFLYLACLRAGLVYHPLNTAYTPSELEYFLANAEPGIVVCDPAAEAQMRLLLETVGDGNQRLMTLDAKGCGSLIKGLNECARQPVATSQGSDLAVLLYSSGTTGRPKGIMLSHDNLRTNAETLVKDWQFKSSDRLLHMLPIYHVHGLFVGISCVLMSGASMAWHSSYSDEAAVTALPECTVMMGVPTYYTRLLSNTEFGPQCCSNMRLFISGSAPLLAETFAEFEQRCGHRILERYGMSETGMNTSNPLNGERRAGTVGPALAGVSVRVVDDSGRQLKTGEIGNLQVSGPNVFSGYWRMPEKTAEDFTSDGYFNTGDKATIDAGGYVSIVGRAKDLVISGGLNVYPKEVELVIDDMDGVQESAVIGVPDSDFGEAVVAVVVALTADEPPTKPAIIAQCKTQLANFKVPKRIEFLDVLPRNAMGKVQKNKLRERYTQ